MKLWSDSWTNGDPIPPRYAAGKPDGAGGACFGDNVNPHLAWSDLPPGTGSLVLICHDFDVPNRSVDANPPGQELPSAVPRMDFFHWVMVDLPLQPAFIAEGQYSRAFVPRGKPQQQAGGVTTSVARQGVNDYTLWFAGHADLAGQYFGYDGPFPPVNDPLVHHCVFTLYAVQPQQLPLPAVFTGSQVRQALAGVVLAEATLSGTYTLNPRWLAAS